MKLFRTLFRIPGLPLPLSLSLLLLAGGTALAEPEAASPPPAAAEPPPGGEVAAGAGPRRDRDRERDRRPPEDPRQTFKRADLNGDGYLSFEEFSGIERIAKLPEDKRAALFKRFDKDGDGKVSAEEMQPMRRGGMESMEKLDLNKDGRITFDEFEKSPFIAKLPEDQRRALFDRMDTDKDGALTPKDRPPHRPPSAEFRRRMMLDLIRDLDKNGDGALSFEEFRQAPFLKDRGEEVQKRRFDEMDRNHDSKIDAADLPPVEELREGKPGPGAGPEWPDRGDKAERPDRPERADKAERERKGEERKDPAK